MAKTKITVPTTLGTFTRTTERTYSHVVVVKDYTMAYAAQHRGWTISRLQDDRRYWIDAAATKRAGGNAGYHAGEKTAEQLDQLAADCAAQLQQVEAQTVEEYRAGMKNAAAGVLGWCGRLDLARKLRTSKAASIHETVEIFSVTGEACR